MTVFEYSFIVPDDPDRKIWKVLWDYQIGLVRVTPFFKALGFSKVCSNRSCSSSRANSFSRPPQRKPSELTQASKTLSTASRAARSRLKATGSPSHARAPSARPSAGTSDGCLRRSLGHTSSQSVCRRTTKTTDAGRSTAILFAGPSYRQRAGEPRQAVAQHLQVSRTGRTLHRTFPCTNHRPPPQHPTLARRDALRGRSRSSRTIRRSAQAPARAIAAGLSIWSPTNPTSLPSRPRRPPIILGGQASTNVLQLLQRRATHLLAPLTALYTCSPNRTKASRLTNRPGVASMGSAQHRQHQLHRQRELPPGSVRTVK